MIRQLENEVDRTEKLLEGTTQDLETSQNTQGDRFIIELAGQTIRDRATAGDWILRRSQQINGQATERPLGTFAGFDLFISSGPTSAPQVLIKGEATHAAKVTNTPQGTIRSLEHTLQNLDDAAEKLASKLTAIQKRLTDLQEHINQPFEHSETLAALLERQKAISEELDLT